MKEMSHEAPVKKRQRIENNNLASSSNTSTNSSSGNSSKGSSSSPSTSSFSSTTSIDETANSNGNDSDVSVHEHNESTEWLEALQTRQCLCGISETTARRPFLRYLQHTAELEPLDEWSSETVLKFLSSLQTFFDIYLKQNRRGNICSKSMELCESLISGSGGGIVDDVLQLCNKRLQQPHADTKFVLHLSSRVISYYLIIVKDDMDHKWLKKIVDNLFMFESLNEIAIRKINFSLDIIKCIIEFKDMDEHPLDQDDAEEEDEYVPPPSLALPPIENNYFAQQYFNSDAAGPSTATPRLLFGDVVDSSAAPHHVKNLPDDCHFVTLTDSESFDTTEIKRETIKILENKWPALVQTMSKLIANHRSVYADTCALTFLELWENIISVKTNLSVVETQPFHAQLDKFETLLCTHLPPIVYKQILALFNEALCYGSTLALQDLLPDETCSLAHQIVRHVKDFRILDFLPRQRLDNVGGFGGETCKQIEYETNNFTTIKWPPQPQAPLTFDRTLLQKMTLLVLKAVAVTVKEIRSDSSDSSIDSADYDAFQDMLLIERSIRDVMKKLETFIKNTMEFHPETHLSKILIHLFSDQDDYLVEAMVCTLDVTAGISFRNNAFPELVAMLNPVYTFLEFLKMISNSSDLLLDLLVSNETCFLLYLLRFLKYIRINWAGFVQSCQSVTFGNNCLDDTMSVLIRLRLQISRLVAKSLFPYDISPILRLLESCESLYEGNELS